MALSQSQEDILAEIITAYANGKRLTELPEVSGANPFELFCEVLDTDGESKKAALATLLPYLEEDCAYGVEFDTTVSSPTCTRIGNMTLHRTLPVQSRMKGCLLDDNGNVVEYLPQDTWEGVVRDGSRGQVMVEIPTHYRRFITDGTKRRVMLSEFPLPGYHQVRRFYVSAYEASLQRSSNKLASVVNTTPDYRGGNNQSAWDNTYRSVLGRPVSYKSMTDLRTYARNRKQGSVEWNICTYDAYKTLFWLVVVEYSTLNSQLGFNPQLTVDGYHQGCLGPGGTTWGASGGWNAFNGYYPFIPCGYTDAYGNGSGDVLYEAVKEDGTPQPGIRANRYRGVENIYGHIRTWCDGILVMMSPNVESGGTGLSQAYACSDPALFSSTSVNGYRFIGNQDREGGWIKEMLFGEFGDIIPKSCGGGSSSYYTDYHHGASSSFSATTWKASLFGGNATAGSLGGFACVMSSNAPSFANTGCGSRLCFLPE